MEHYNDLPKEVRKVLLRSANKYVDYFMKVSAVKDSDLLQDIMQSTDVEKLVKVKILTSAIEALNFKQAKEMLSAIDTETYGKILKAGATRHIGVTPNVENGQLFEALKTTGWIKSYESGKNECLIERMPIHNESV